MHVYSIRFARGAGLGIALLLGVAACREKTVTAAPPHVVLSGAGAELRNAFNAEAGKVRVVMLVSPT
jgi:hypothetical protein